MSITVHHINVPTLFILHSNWKYLPSSIHTYASRNFTSTLHHASTSAWEGFDKKPISMPYPRWALSLISIGRYASIPSICPLSLGFHAHPITWHMPQLHFLPDVTFNFIVSLNTSRSRFSRFAWSLILVLHIKLKFNDAYVPSYFCFPMSYCWYVFFHVVLFLMIWVSFSIACILHMAAHM